MFTERQTLRVMEVEHDMIVEIAEISHDQDKEAMDIGNEHAKEQAEHGASIAPPEEKKSVTTGGGKKTVTVTKKGSLADKQGKAAGNSVKAKSAPTNQYGTKTGPQKSRLDQLLLKEQPVLDYFEKRYGKDSLEHKTNIAACKQRIIKRLRLTETDAEVRNSATLLDKYFDIV
jgi:hypothetical protein